MIKLRTAYRCVVVENSRLILTTLGFFNVHLNPSVFPFGPRRGWDFTHDLELSSATAVSEAGLSGYRGYSNIGQYFFSFRKILPKMSY